jgi:hypothetical protein
MDEATAFLVTLQGTAPDAPTACAGWTAHDLVAHLAAGAAEMADLTESTVAGRPHRETRAFADREAPFVALRDDELRERLFSEALRLQAAIESLATSDGGFVSFSGREHSAAELSLHGRSEAALHRWDLVGDDEMSDQLLSQPELTRHAVTVLNEMLSGSGESPAARAAAAGTAAGRWALASPGEPDVVVTVDGDGAHFELCDPLGEAAATSGPATRLLALWGRRGTAGPIEWRTDDVRRELGAFLWPTGSMSHSGYPDIR